MLIEQNKTSSLDVPKAVDDNAPVTAEGISRDYKPPGHSSEFNWRIAPEFRLPISTPKAGAPADDDYKPLTAAEIAKDFDLPR